MNQKLSAHFFIQEFTRSEQAARMGRAIDVTPDILANLTRLCTQVLEPIRTQLDNRVTTITSGYRPEWLNRLVGGSRTSDHPKGLAADLIVQGFTPFQVCRAVQPILHLLPINQLIYEFGGWTHVSVCAEGDEPRRQVLTAHYVDGILTYTAGLIEQQRATP
jgi:hypothetical protein